VGRGLCVETDRDPCAVCRWVFSRPGCIPTATPPRLLRLSTRATARARKLQPAVRRSRLQPLGGATYSVYTPLQQTYAFYSRHLGKRCCRGGQDVCSSQPALQGLCLPGERAGAADDREQGARLALAVRADQGGLFWLLHAGAFSRVPARSFHCLQGALSYSLHVVYVRRRCTGASMLATAAPAGGRPPVVYRSKVVYL
jgi:hypothetical protein